MSTTLESWSQLQTGAGKILLVVYEEEAPSHLLPGYDWEPCALSLVLGHPASGLTTVSRPYHSSQESNQNATNSIASSSLPTAGFALLKTLLDNKRGSYSIEVSQGKPRWLVQVVIQ